MQQFQVLTGLLRYWKGKVTTLSPYLMVNIKYYCCWWSFFDLPSLVSFIWISPIAAAVRHGRYSFVFASSVDIFVFTDDGCFSTLQCNSSGYKYWIGRLIYDFHVLNPTAHINPSLPLYNLSTILIFHFPLSFSSPLIKTMSPMISASLLLDLTYYAFL